MKKSLITISALAAITMSAWASDKRVRSFTSLSDDLSLQFEMQRAERDTNTETWKEIEKLRSKLRPIYQAKYAALQKKTLFSMPRDQSKLQDWLLVRHRLSAFYLALYAPVGSPGALTILEILRNEAREESLGGIK